MSRSTKIPKKDIYDWGDEIPLGKLKGKKLTRELISSNYTYFGWILENDVLPLSRSVEIEIEDCLASYNRSSGFHDEDDYWEAEYDDEFIDPIWSD